MKIKYEDKKIFVVRALSLLTQNPYLLAKGSTNMVYHKHFFDK